jgi:hypothetical protein
MSRAFVVLPYHLLYLNLKLLSAKLSCYSDFSQAFGAEGRISGRSIGLFYCSILYALRGAIVELHR